MIDFVDYLIPQSAATSDIDIASADGNTIPWELLTTIREMDGVKEVYGRRSVFDVSAKLNDNTNFSGTVDLISYDDFDLQCLKKDSALKRGSDLSKVFRDSNFVLATSDQDSTWKIGDTVQIGDETLTIAGLLKNDPFSENGLTNGRKRHSILNGCKGRRNAEQSLPRNAGREKSCLPHLPKRQSRKMSDMSTTSAAPSISAQTSMKSCPLMMSV